MGVCQLALRTVGREERERTTAHPVGLDLPCPPCSLSVPYQATRDAEPLGREEPAVVWVRDLPDLTEESRRDRGVREEGNGLVARWGGEGLVRALGRRGEDGLSTPRESESAVSLRVSAGEPGRRGGRTFLEEEVAGFLLVRRWRER